MTSNDTPMFRQYTELKAAHPDALLFFRMGDFYELFFDDARVAAEVLELTLTSRDKDAENPVPMAGVPHHAARGYLRTLAEAGYKVAIADQVEDPKQAKGLVRREIVRVVSPGVGLDPEDITPRESCWLASVAPGSGGGPLGLALYDVSVGDLRVTELRDTGAVADELLRAAPKEAVLAPSLMADPALAEALRGLRINQRPEGELPPEQARRALHARFGDEGLAETEGLGPALAAAEAALAYAQGNTFSDLSGLTRLRPYTVSGFMVMDGPTRRNLELTQPLMGGARKATLLHLLDRTCTAMGGRLLREWLGYPLLDIAAIRARHDAVGCLLDDPLARRALREGLKEVADLERLCGKLAQSTANARDLVRLRLSLEALPGALAPIVSHPPLSRLIPKDLCPEIAATIAHWLVDEPPIAIGEGGLLRAGVDPELDELVGLSGDAKARIAAMEDRERESTGISSLKIRYNRVFGYYIEISNANLHKAPDRYLRKQTLSTGERYFTPELKEFEEKVIGADERRKSLELDRFLALRAEIALAVPRLRAVAALIAELDVFGSFAEVAANNRFVRPELDNSTELDIVAGRHPVVEQQSLSERFVPNDLRLGARGRRLLILTGPNMSGKSTVMRQAALLVLMAQIGSFVAADKARVGVCDRIFTRIGASDDLASGRSTFMVEMSETANILRYATERSLVLLDEIGRGTSTYDGLAIAWAVSETLHDRIRARTLFATHYHELIELADTRQNVANVSVAVAEYGDRILFLRRLKEGGASRSYGIQCARLAGLPREVIDRARGLLTQLEKHAATTPGPQLTLFGASTPEPEPEAADPLREALAALNPDALSPREALEALYRLRALA